MGRIIEKNWYSWYSIREEGRITFKYNHQGNLIEQKTYPYTKETLEGRRRSAKFLGIDLADDVDKPLSITFYKYDDRGNIIEQKQNGINITYKYEYDEMNNWTRQIKFVVKISQHIEIPQYIVEREIEYYD